MSFDESDFTGMTKPHKKYVQTANGEFLTVQGTGTINISPALKISNCLYVPTLSHKLLSVSHATKELNCTLLMQPSFCMLHDIQTGMIVGHGTERRGLYYVDEVAQQSTAMLTHGSTDRQAWLWHRRLGHPSLGYLKVLFPSFDKIARMDCDTCFLAKSHRHSFKANNSRVDQVFSLIHSDVWGPAPIMGGQGFRYFVLFIDDCSRMTWIYFMKSKSEVFDKFVLFYTFVQTQYKKIYKSLGLIMGGSMSMPKCNNSLLKMALYIKPLALTHLSKTG